MFSYHTETPYGTFTKESNRKYTHLVVSRKNDSVREVGYCGSEELAERKEKLQRAYGYTQVSIHPVRMLKKEKTR